MFNTFAKFSSFDCVLLTLFTPFVEMLCLILFLVNSSLCIWLFFHLSVAMTPILGLIINKQAFQNCQY